MRVGGRKFWVIVLCSAISAVVALELWERVSYERAKKAIARAKALCTKLPPGSTRVKVEAFLQGKGIEHSFSENPTPGVGSHELAILRDVCGARIVGCDVALSFNFDDRGLLTSCSAKEMYTGP